LADRVVFCGNQADLGPMLARASLFLHPSRYESFGIAVFEAMQAGVPPVVARGASVGYREILDDGVDSVAVDFAQPDSAAEAIRLLLTDHVRRAAMGVAARQAAARALAVDYAVAFRGLVTRLLAAGVS
jgi:glycosyltransferase involved in cell wall biosynthesis